MRFNADLRLTREVENDLTWLSSLDRKIPIQALLLHDNRIRCFQHGMGSFSRHTTNREEMVQGGASHHKLFGASSFLSGTTMLCQAQPGHSNSNEIRQCHSSDLYQQTGGTHSPLPCRLAITIWDWCIQRNIFLLAEHLPGSNLAVDQESRSLKDHCDWMLNPLKFNSRWAPWR